MLYKKSIISLCVAVMLLTAAGVAIHSNLIILPFTRTTEARLFDGLNDDRILVGASHVVVVGKVIKKIGQTEGEAGPLTQFEIQIVQSIKGKLSGSFVLNQEGGYQNGILSLVEDQALLLSGTTYLLSARTDGQGNYLVIPFPRARLPISADAKLTLQDLVSLSALNKDVAALRDAYTHEIPLQMDVDSGNAYNSYRSLNTQ